MPNLIQAQSLLITEAQRPDLLPLFPATTRHPAFVLALQGYLWAFSKGLHKDHHHRPQFPIIP